MSDVVAIILAEASEQNAIQADVTVLLGNLQTIKLQLNDVTDGHDELKAQVDELIAALTEQDIDTETFLGQITRLFEDAGYTANGNVFTKAEATVTIRDTDFILLVDGVNISLSDHNLSGDAQDDFDIIDAAVTQRLNRLVWDSLYDLLYIKGLEWVSNEVVDGIDTETLTNSVTFVLNNDTKAFISLTIDGVTHTDIDVAIAAVEAYELPLPSMSESFGLENNFSGGFSISSKGGVNLGDHLDGLLFQVDGGVISDRYVGWSQRAIDFAGNVESATVTVTHPDFEGAIGTTVDNPDYQPLLSESITVTERTTTGNNPLFISSTVIDNLGSVANVTINGNDAFVFTGGNVQYINNTEAELSYVITVPGYRGEVTGTFDNPNYVELTLPEKVSALFYDDNDFTLQGNIWEGNDALVSVTPSQQHTGGVQIRVTDGTTQYFVADLPSTADAQGLYDSIITSIETWNASNSSGDTLSSVGQAAILYKDDTSTFVHNGVGFTWNSAANRFDIIGATGGETALWVTYDSSGNATGAWTLAINGQNHQNFGTPSITGLLARVAQID